MKAKGIFICALCGLLLAGCGTKETGSELLTETKEAVEPVSGTVEPAVEETSEGIALHVYSGDDQAENIVRHTVYVDEVSEQTVMAELVKALGMDEDAGLLSIDFGTHGGDRVVMLDLNQAFADYVNRLGSSGEYIAMGSLTNTFLDCYQSELLLVTAEGRVLETGHTIYEEYLEMYPYLEASYRVQEQLLEAENMEISCPQLEGLPDSGLQGKWNRIFLGTEERAMDDWDGTGVYTVNFEVKTMTADVLSILMNGQIEDDEAGQSYAFKYTYNIDLNTGESIRLRDLTDVEEVAKQLFQGTGYYVEEKLAPYFIERLNAIYENPEELARSLEGYDYAEDGSAPYGYSYLADGRVWICMEVPHELGDYIEIELDTSLGNAE